MVILFRDYYSSWFSISISKFLGDSDSDNLLAHAVDVLVTDVLPQHPPTRVLLSTLLADEAAAVPSGFCRGPGVVILLLALDIN